MARSIKKGPFVDLHLAKKIDNAIAKNDKKVMNFKSLNQPEIISLSFDKLTTPLQKSWVNYPLGVIA